MNFTWIALALFAIAVSVFTYHHLVQTQTSMDAAWCSCTTFLGTIAAACFSWIVVFGFCDYLYGCLLLYGFDLGLSPSVVETVIGILYLIAAVPMAITSVWIIFSGPLIRKLCGSLENAKDLPLYRIQTRVKKLKITFSRTRCTFPA